MHHYVKEVNKLFTYLIFCICIVLVLGVVLFSRINQNQVKAGESDSLYGWAWSENFGWVSLNCNNFYDGNLEDHCTIDYGVNLNISTNNLEKYAWSENVGWINFDPTGPYPQAPNYSARLNNEGIISGWAQVVNLADEGWINFLGEDCTTSPDCAGKIAGSAPTYVLDDDATDGQSSLCYNCDKYSLTCDGGSDEGNFCDIDDDCDGIGTCTGDYALDPNGELFCAICFSGHLPDPEFVNSQKFPTDVICSLDSTIAKNNSNRMCNNCQTYTDPGDTEEITVCENCPKCYDHGVGINYKNGQLVGWSWSDNSDGNGLGWLQFDPHYSLFGGPWLQTRLGGIYSKGSVGSQFTYPPPATKFSSTYEIHAKGTITHFETQAGGSFRQELFDELDFPDSENIYTNALGRIDFRGIEAGQYGDVEDIVLVSEIDQILGGKVYIKDGDLTINTPITFQEGDNDTPNGSGLIIIEGNLNINANILYSSGLISSLKNLPSVAWIVKGDIVIDPNVQTLAGAYIALGDGDPEECPNLEDPPLGCGRISTGSSSTLLDFYGLVMAKQFNFQRSYFSPDRGAEQAIYDGRALANTPPGLGDITQVLPVWKEIAP